MFIKLNPEKRFDVYAIYTFLIHFLQHWVDTSAGGQSILEGIISSVVIMSVLTLYVYMVRSIISPARSSEIHFVNRSFFDLFLWQSKSLLSSNTNFIWPLNFFYSSVTYESSVYKTRVWRNIFFYVIYDETLISLFILRS